MAIKDLEQSQFVDLFGDLGTGDQNNSTAFRAGVDDIPDLTLNADGNVTNNTPAVTDTTQQVIDEAVENSDADVDLTDGDDNESGTEPQKRGPGRPRKNESISDLQSYFSDRIKAGKFIPIKEDAEDGPKDFIPSTAEEFDEVIDMQVQYRVEEERKKLEQSWYQSKSPAWQAVAKYAEYTDDPSELLPFISGVKTIESVANINEEEIDGAERIVRTRLQQRGDSEDIIEEQIEALKTTDKLISTAKKYKPTILQEEKKQLGQMMAQKEQQEQQREQLYHHIRENTIKTLEAPLFGKQTLKNEEKMMVFDLIGQPDDQSQGYRIYPEIDKLFEKGDFAKLAKIALLLANEESLTGYISTTASDKTAAGLERKLRLATDSRSSGKDIDTGSPVIQRNQPFKGGGSGGFRKS